MKRSKTILSRLIFIGSFLLMTVGRSPVLLAQQPHFSLHPVNRALLTAGPDLLYIDHESRLWIGTKNGLFRGEASMQLYFPLPDERKLSVTAISQTSDGKLWVGFVTGEIAYLEQNRLHYWLPEEGVPGKTITGFAEDSKKQLWISTYGEGLYCLAANGRLYNFGPDDGPINLDVYTISHSATGAIWAGTDAGIAICTFSEGEKTIRSIRPIDGLPDEIILALAATETGMWIGTHQGGIAFYDTESKEFLQSDAPWRFGPVSRLVPGFGNEVYGLSQRGQFFRFRDDKVEQIRPDAPEDLRFQGISLDQEGNLWILDRESGLYSGALRFEFLLTDIEGVQSVLKTSNNQLWIGTDKGVYRQNSIGSGTFELLGNTATDNILCFYEVPNAKQMEEPVNPVILIGTFGQGLLICRGDSCRRLRETDGLSNDNILSIDGTQDTIWLATLGGVSNLPVRTLNLTRPVVKKVERLGSSFVYQLRCDSQGKVWLATDGEGLLIDDDGKLERLNNIVRDGDTLPINTVMNLAESQTGKWWINSHEEGLLIYEPGDFHQPPVSLFQLAGRDEVSALIEDINGQLVVVYPGGVDLLPSGDHNWLSFGTEVGFATSGSALNATNVDEEGNIWFIAGRQIVRYRPLLTIQSAPITVLESVTASGQLISEDKAVLDHNENHLVFNYRGNWLTHQEAVSYRYRLKGQDPEWINSTDHRATYSNLPAGDYEFLLETGLFEQFCGEPDLVYKFRIRQVWWQRWWALLLFVVFGGYGMEWIASRQRKRRARTSQLDRDRINNELAVLKAQINPHFLFNSFSTLIATIEQSQDLGIAYAEQLSTFFRRVLSMKDTNLLPLTEEIELVENYFFLLQQRYGDKLRMEIDFSDKSGQLPPMSLQILVENAVKHNVVSKRQPLMITMSRNGSNLLVCNPIQPKRKPEPSTGFGLDAIRRRYQLLNAPEIVVREENGLFCVYLPIL